MYFFRHMMAEIKVRIEDMRRSETGSFSVEGVLMFPLLIWAYIGLYVFFEGLRENNINLKAAYTIGDLLSRETDEIGPTHLAGMVDVYEWLTRTRNDVAIRLTVISYDEDSDSHNLIYSRTSGSVRGAVKQQLDQTGVNDVVTPHVPIMANADTAIVIETWAYFEPVFEIGLDNTEIYNIIVTAPRFSEQLLWQGLNDGTGSTHNDGTTNVEDSDV